MLTHDKGRYWQLYVDGASRGNPGPAGAGIYILCNGAFFFHEGFFLGIKTNNQAEYLAYIIGLCQLREWFLPQDTVALFSDSQLLVNQLRGEYKVKNSGIQQLFPVARELTIEMKVLLTHIMREENREADKMANKGVDTATLPPDGIVSFLRKHEIIL